MAPKNRIVSHVLLCILSLAILGYANPGSDITEGLATNGRLDNLPLNIRMDAMYSHH